MAEWSLTSASVELTCHLLQVSLMEFLCAMHATIVVEQVTGADLS
jgi:hypothetical protein